VINLMDALRKSVQAERGTAPKARAAAPERRKPQKKARRAG